jgi:hypothetical protein
MKFLQRPVAPPLPDQFELWKDAPPDEEKEHWLTLSGVTSVAALLISLVTFGAHFLAHDSTTFVLTELWYGVTQNPDHPDRLVIIRGAFTMLNGGNRTSSLLPVEAFIVPDKECKRPKDSEWLPLAEIEHNSPIVIESSKASVKTFSFEVIGEANKTLSNVEGYVCLAMRAIDSDAQSHSHLLPFLRLSVDADRKARTADIKSGMPDDDPFRPIKIVEKRTIEWPY